MSGPRQATRAAVLFLAAALAAAAWSLPARPAAAAGGDPPRLSVAEYEAMLEQVAGYLDRAGTAPTYQVAAELRAAAELLPEQVLVATPGGDTLVDHRPLRERLRRITFLPAEEKDQAMRTARLTVWAQREVLGGAGSRNGAGSSRLPGPIIAEQPAPGLQPLLDLAAERQRLARILRPAPPNPLRQLRDRLAEWLAGYFSGISLPQGTGKDAGPWIVLVLASVGLVVVVWAVVFVTRQFRRQRGLVAAGDAAPPARGRSLGPDAQAEDCWREASRLAAASDFRPAMRALYLAVLLHLDRSGRIRYRAAATNGAYLRELTGAPELYPTVQELTRLFESRWYGCTPAGAADFATAAGLAARAWTTAGGQSLPQEVMPGGPPAG